MLNLISGKRPRSTTHAARKYISPFHEHTGRPTHTRAYTYIRHEKELAGTRAPKEKGKWRNLREYYFMCTKKKIIIRWVCERRVCVCCLMFEHRNSSDARTKNSFRPLTLLGSRRWHSAFSIFDRKNTLRVCFITSSRSHMLVHHTAYRA